MQLFDSISKIRDRGINVNNHSVASSQAIDWEATQEQYENAVFEITGSYIHSQFQEQAKQLFVNVVSNLVHQNEVSETGVVNVNQALGDARKQTEKYFSVFSSKVPKGKRCYFQYADPAFVKQVREEHAKNYVRPKTKQERAIEIVNANPNMSNKDLQAIFRTELNLTPNGAATYVYNVKKIIKSQK